MQKYSGPGGLQRGIPYEFKPSGAETASTTHKLTPTGHDGGALYVVVNVTAASGTTPTLSVVVEGSEDGGTNWFNLGTIGANGYSVGPLGTAPSNFTGTGTVRAIFARPQMVRTRSVVGGTTPSFTYSVEAVIL